MDDPGAKGEGRQLAELAGELGLELDRRDEWTDVRVGGNHRLTVSVLGGRVLLSQPSGYTTLESLIPALELVKHVADDAIPPPANFVWIADYSGLDGSSRESRKYYAETTASWSRLHTVVLCGLSPILSVAAKLATKLHLVRYDVRFAAALDEAVRIAVEVVQKIDAEALHASREAAPEGWQLALDGFFIRMESIDGRYLFAEASGRMEERHIDAMFELQERVFAASDLVPGKYGVVVGVHGLESVSYRARHHYLGRMTRWFEAYPFAVQAFYGANPLLRAALNLTRPFAPFEARLAADREAAFQLADEALARPATAAGASRESEGRKRAGDAQIRDYVDQLLDVLSEVNWDAASEKQPRTHAPDHPFAPVFDAIELVHCELQDLLRDKEMAEAKQRRLLERLARARKMEALGLLAGGVAHDLNNVLSGIVTYPDFLLLNDDLDHDMRTALLTIKRSGEQAAAIVNDLVTIARGVAVNTQPVLIDDVVEDYFASPQFAKLAEFHPWVDIRAVLGAPGHPIIGSHVHLKKVVMNLVSNATESVPEERGGGEVRVETAVRFVDRPIPGVDELNEGEYTVLSVVDNGPGIAPQELDRIFEPFYTKKVMGRSGTGLGLTVVWNTVQDHGGVIDVTSSDRGTRFDLYFPVTMERPEQPRPAAAVDDYRGNGEHILVVDDVANQREIASTMLASLGYRVATADSGEEAVRLVAETAFDLVILDMIMEPGMNGRQCYEGILALRPAQKALITSGFSATEEVAHAQRLGAGAFLGKPYSLEGIGLAIRDELRRDAAASRDGSRPR